MEYELKYIYGFITIFKLSTANEVDTGRVKGQA